MSPTTPPGPAERGRPGRQRIHLREIEDGADEEHDSVGEELRAARLRRGEELAAISRVLKIGRVHLAALEEGRTDDLPGRAYALGFVRSYAAYLGLDPGRCADRFKTESGWRFDSHSGPAPLPRAHYNRLPLGWVVIAVVVGLVVLYGGYQLARSLGGSQAPSVAPVPARIADFPSQRPSQAALPKKSPASHPGTHVPAGSPAPGMAIGSGVQLADQPLGQSPAGSTAVLPTGQVYGQHNLHVRVILHVGQAAHVLVKSRTGKVYIDRFLQPGDAYRVPDLVGLSLTTSDGAAVSLELDGRDLGPAGLPGEAAETLSLDPQAIVDRAGGHKPG